MFKWQHGIIKFISQLCLKFIYYAFNFKKRNEHARIANSQVGSLCRKSL